MDYIVCISSYKRKDLIKEKTLNLLLRNKIPNDKIFIFLSNKEDLQDYKTSLKDKKYDGITLVNTNANSLVQKENYIYSHFPIGKKMVMMHDDNEEIWECKENKNSSKIRVDLKKFFPYSFKVLEDENAFLWTLNYTNNCFFGFNDKKDYTTGLVTAPGGIYGIINRQLLIPEKYIIKEDAKRTAMYWKKDGKIIRFPNIHFQSPIRVKESGGLETQFGKKRLALEKKTSFMLQKEYPDIIEAFLRKDGKYEGVWEVRFKHIKSNQELEGSGNKNFPEICYCIPSYNREEIIKDKSLKFLLDNKIPTCNIFIFLSNNEQIQKYKNSLKDKKYQNINLINSNMPSLTKKVNFMITYFPVGQKMVVMNDDLKGLYLCEDKLNKNKKKINLKNFINRAYEVLKEENAFIFSINLTGNCYFTTQSEYSTGLKLMGGLFYGFINRHIKTPEKYISKEDVARSLIYWEKDKKLIRFDKVIAISKDRKEKGGLQSELGDERKNIELQMAKFLKQDFPDLGDIVIRDKGEFKGWAEYKFKGLKGGGVLNEIQEIKEYKYPSSQQFKNVENELLKELESKPLPKIEGIRSDMKATRGTKLGDVNARTITFGYGNRRNWGYGEFNANKKRPELYKKLIEFGHLISPKGFDFNAIVVNHNINAKKHIDGLNNGNLVITAIGDFTGGGLYVYDDDGKKDLYKLKNNILLINGAEYFHETEKWKGNNRYTLVYFTQKPPKNYKGKIQYL